MKNLEIDVLEDANLLEEEIERYLSIDMNKRR